MRELEAKDFLVQQATEQAAIQNIPLSDLEKRMMYFTETGEMRENAAELHDAFEAEYDAAGYEAKISKVMHYAHERIKREHPEAARQWNEAICQLSRGDHYLLILCKEGFGLAQASSQERPPYDSLKLLGTAILVVAAMFLFGVVWERSGLHFPYHVNWPVLRVVLYSFFFLSVVTRIFWLKTRKQKPSRKP